MPILWGSVLPVAAALGFGKLFGARLEHYPRRLEQAQGRLPSLMISCSAGEAVRWEDAQGNILQWESPSPAFLKLLWHDERRPDATPSQPAMWC